MASRSRGTTATTREEAEAAAKELFDAGATGVVVKAQIHAGGRGKGGGVKIASRSPRQANLRQDSRHDAHHAQTGPEGRVVRRLLIEKRCRSRRNFTSASSSTVAKQAGFHGLCRRWHGYRAGRRRTSRAI